MKLTLHCKYAEAVKSASCDDTHDLILGRPGKTMPIRRRHQEVTVISTGDHIAVDDGRVPAILFDLTPDRKVSRIHGRLYYDLSAWWVEPLGQTNPIYLNSLAIGSAAQLKHGDVLRVGESLLGIDLPGGRPEPDTGIIDSTLPADDTLPETAIAEDRRLLILNRIMGMIAYSRSRQSLVDGLIRELGDAFPKASRRTLLLIEKQELVPRAFWPPDECRISFVLARDAIRKRESIHWRRDPKVAVSPSLVEVTDALYAPMIFREKAIGLLHVDNVTATPMFTEADLHMLMTIATTAAGPLLDVSQGPSDVLAPLPEVFLSYAREQKEFAQHLTAALRRNRVKVWMDDRINTGEAWRAELLKAITHTNALVLLVSKDSIDSEWVKWEFDQAQSLGRPVLPVLFEESDLPPWLKPLQYADARRSLDIAVREVAERAQSTLQTS